MDTQNTDEQDKTSPQLNDFETPFSPADETTPQVKEHPATDSAVDSHEEYDEGVARAVGIKEESKE